MDIQLEKEKPSLHRVVTSLHRGIFWTKWRWVDLTELAAICQRDAYALLLQFVELPVPLGRNDGKSLYLITEMEAWLSGKMEYSLFQICGRRHLLYGPPWDDGRKRVSPLEYLSCHRVFVPAGWALAVIAEVEKREKSRRLAETASSKT